MGEHVIKLPDVGEGVAEAELVEWLVDIGSNVTEDQPLAAVMTDKATVEIPSPVEGKIIWHGAEIGEIVAVGSPIIRLEVDGPGNVKPGDAAPVEAPKANGAAETAPKVEEKPAPKVAAKIEKPKPAARPAGNLRKEGQAPLASPAVRKRALDNGVDLRRVAGSGPAGRITHEDLDGFFETGGAIARGGGAGRSLVANTSIEEIPVRGLRRKIAEKMSAANERIVPITYVDEIDVTALEDLRKELNASRKDGRPKLTILPFLMRAMVKAIADQPQMSATFDDDNGVIHQSGGVHIGIAAQTDNGLMVPVARHCEARDIWDCAEEVGRLSDAAKSGTAARDELSGSTITITSLGAMGGIVTTPIINHPEVAIVGVNKMQILPRWDGQSFQPRKVMNLSSSFDHRVIDGWDAAVFIQRIKQLLENPAMIFVED